MSELTGPIYERQDYAGFIRRTIALLLDVVIVWLSAIGLTVVWGTIATHTPTNNEMAKIMNYIFVILLVLYMIGFRLTLNGTLGYRIVRIRYAYVLNEKPPLGAIVFRSAVAVALLLFFAFDHFWILFDERKQAWHDKVSGFYVVKHNAQPSGTQQICRRVINFMTLTFFVWEPVADTQSTQ